MARNCALSESEKAAKKAARLDTLRRRDKLGLAIVTRKRRARESFVAQQLTSSLPVTPDRRSARVREQGGAKKLVFSPTGSTESASRRADADYSPIKTITIRVYDADGSTSTYKTPSKFSKGDIRPRPDQLHDSFVSDDGVLRCTITGQNNKNGTVQFAHVVDRSLERDLVRGCQNNIQHEADTLSTSCVSWRSWRECDARRCLSIRGRTSYLVRRQTDVLVFMLLTSYFSLRGDPSPARPRTHNHSTLHGRLVGSAQPFD